MNGDLQVAENNDAALDIDLGEDSPNWKPVLAGKEIIRISTGDGMSFTTDDVDTEEGWIGSRWGDVKYECEIAEQLRELALFAGEPEAYLFADTDGERFPYRGGGWSYTSGAGVFCAYLSIPRTSAGTGIGFRSAFFRKTEN